MRRNIGPAAAGPAGPAATALLGGRGNNRQLIIVVACLSELREKDFIMTIYDRTLRKVNSSH